MMKMEKSKDLISRADAIEGGITDGTERVD